MPMTQGAALGRTPQDPGIFRDSADNWLTTPWKNRALRAPRTATPHYPIASSRNVAVVARTCSRLDVLPMALRPLRPLRLLRSLRPLRSSTTVRPYVRYRYSQLRPEA
jgi:hypothetical protein